MTLYRKSFVLLQEFWSIIKQYKGQVQNNPKFKQTVTLLSVNILSIPISIVSSIIITRFLGPSAYGDFQFLFNVINLSVVVLTFGFFQAGNRALVLNNDARAARELYAAVLVILVFLFLVMSIVLMIYAILDENINEKGIRHIFFLLIPFSWVFLLVKYFEVLFQADNKIKLLAASRFFPKLAFLIVVLIIYLVWFDYSGDRLKIILGASLLTQIITYSYIVYRVHPSFKNLKNRIREIYFFNRAYGFNVYLGSVMAVGFSQLTGILISYFAGDNSGVGFYSLAVTIAGPLSFIPNIIATTHYKDFSSSKSIPRKLLLLTLAISFVALIMTLVLVNPFIKYFYGEGFYPVISLTYIVSFGIILNGFADFVNRFLGAHGEGKALRNSAFIVGFGLMTLNILLIPRYGETGAAFTQLFSGLIYILCMYWYYRRFTRRAK